MYLKKLIPILYTREITATIAFYENVLAFTAVRSEGHPPASFSWQKMALKLWFQNLMNTPLNDAHIYGFVLFSNRRR